MKRFCIAGVVFVALCRMLSAQNFDFENGILDWHQEGGAFRNQPYCGPITSTVFAASKLGGDYWKDLPYPLGQNGHCLLTTIAKTNLIAVSAVTSPEFLLEARTKFLSFRIGGTEDKSHERLELQVRAPISAESELWRRTREWWE